MVWDILPSKSFSTSVYTLTLWDVFIKSNDIHSAKNGVTGKRTCSVDVSNLP